MTPEAIQAFLFLPLLCAGVLLPGWLLGRAIGRGGGLAGAMLGSCAILMYLVVALDAWDRPVDAPHLSVALASVCAVLAAVTFLRKQPKPLAGNVGAGCTDQKPPWLFLLGVPMLIGAIALGLRLVLDPLSGWDVHFRWDFLAQQILRQGGLDFYPAKDAEDFLHYAWCDGISPLVSSLYVWSYLSLGRIEDGATSPVVLLQIITVFSLTWKIAALRTNRVGAILACALLCTSPVLLWSISIGQETGLTAIAALAVLYFSERYRRSPDAGWIVWGGVAAGCGALAREYGLAYIALGIVLFYWRHAKARELLHLSLVAAIVALPWYLRNWIHVGNPLFPHEIGGLFPSNPVLLAYNRAVDAANGISQAPGVTLPLLARYFFWCGGLPVVVGLIAGLRDLRETRAELLVMLTVTGLWLWSIHLTSGGYLYSLRVLSPCIALGAVLGGCLMIPFARRFPYVVTIGMTVLAFDAGARSLYLPVDSNPPWWRLRPSAWLDFGTNRTKWRESPYWAEIASAAEGRKTLVSDASVHAFLCKQGAKAVPLFSPEVRFLFSAEGDTAKQSEQLRAAGYRFVLITRKNNIQDVLLSSSRYFYTLENEAHPVVTTPLFKLYDLYPASAYRR